MMMQFAQTHDCRFAISTSPMTLCIHSHHNRSLFYIAHRTNVVMALNQNNSSELPKWNYHDRKTIQIYDTRKCAVPSTTNERTTENFACNAYDESSLTARMCPSILCSCFIAVSSRRNTSIWWWCVRLDSFNHLNLLPTGQMFNA